MEVKEIKIRFVSYEIKSNSNPTRMWDRKKDAKQAEFHINVMSTVWNLASCGLSHSNYAHWHNTTKHVH